VFQVQQPTPEVQNYSDATPHTSARQFQPPTCFAVPWRFPEWLCVSLLFEASGTPTPRLRNFDTEP
jgi:hypothetical protein